MSDFLTIYYSHSGNTQAVAELVQKNTQCDLFELVPVTPYPQDYNTVVAIAKKELTSKARPALVSTPPHLEAYNTICFGFPNWWSTMPMLFYTFIEANQDALAQKDILFFCTHGGGGLGHCAQDLAKLLPQSQQHKGLAIYGKATTQANIAQWLHTCGY